MEKERETQRQGTLDFLRTLLNQDLEPNYKLKAPCSCPSFELNSNQEEHTAPPTYTNNTTLTSVRMTPTCKRPRQQQKKKKVEIKSDRTTDSDDRRDNQARRPMKNEIISDWETEIEDDQDTIIEASLKRPKTMPKVLTSRRGKYPLTN